MAHRNPEHYKNSPRSFPSDNIDPSLKQHKDYFLAYAEAMWSEYVANRCAWPFSYDNSDQITIDELRLYATGKQNMNKVKGYMLKPVDPNNPTSGFETKMNISWKSYQIMPKMYDVIRSFNSKIDYEVNATAIDDDSIEMKETDKLYIKYYLDKQVQGFMDKTGFVPQMKMNPDEVGARTAGDVDLLVDAGGFNLEHEIACQVVCNKTKKESYFAVIQDMCFDDIFTIGRAGMKEYVNKNTLTAEVRRIDPKYAVVPKSRYLDFRDKTRWGEVRYMTIGEIRDETDLSTDQLIDLAKDFSFMNPDYERLTNLNGYYDPQGARQDFMDRYGIDPLNDVQIMVLDFQFLSLNIDKFLNSKRETTGISTSKKVSYEYVISDKDANRGDSIENYQSVKKYEAKWIIGSDYFINYGPSEYVKYTGEKGDRKPTLDGHFVQTNNASIVERCVDHVDDINQALFKRRNAINSLPPAPRMIIEQGLLDNVLFGDKLQTPEDLIRAFEEKGVLIVNRQDEFGKPVNVNGKTIEFVPSGIIEDITLFTNEIVNGKEAIKDVTGVNDIVAAQTPEARTGLGVSKLAEVASSNALFPSFNAWKYLYEPTFEGVIGKWQLIVDDNEVDIAHIPLGANTIQVFKIGKQFAKSRFNLRTDMVIGEEEKRMLLQEISNLKEARRQNGGKGGISGAMYLKLYDLIMSGNRKLAMFVLAQAEKLQDERDQAINSANQQQTFQAQSAVADQAEKGKQASYQIEGSVKTNSALIIEAGKRKTMLMQVMVTPVPPGETVNVDFIQQQINKTDAEIQQLLQIVHQESQQAQAPPQQQQLQQAS